MTQPKVFRLTAEAPDPTALTEAARILRGGGLVAFPTETVYGLAVDATNPKAVERLTEVKGRPPDKPYSLHLYSVSQVRDVVPQVPPLAMRLMERFWPGPLTIVVPYGDQNTVGIRIPDHPIAQAFLKACDVPVAAPSANRSGAPPPIDAQQVLEGLGGAFDCLLDGGPTPHARESTVVEVVDGHLEVRREGAVSREALRAVIDAPGSWGTGQGARGKGRAV